MSIKRTMSKDDIKTKEKHSFFLSNFYLPKCDPKDPKCNHKQVWEDLILQARHVRAHGSEKERFEKTNAAYFLFLTLVSILVVYGAFQIVRELA